jgi:hypothetical protein
MKSVRRETLIEGPMLLDREIMRWRAASAALERPRSTGGLSSRRGSAFSIAM